MRTFFARAGCVALAIALALPIDALLAQVAPESWTAAVLATSSAGAVLASDVMVVVRGTGTAAKSFQTPVSAVASEVGALLNLTVGTSGATIPLNNANNTTSGNNTHTGVETFTGAEVHTGLATLAGVVVAARDVPSSLTLCAAATLTGPCAPTSTWPGFDNLVCGVLSGGAITLTMPTGTGLTIPNGYSISINDCDGLASGTVVLTVSANSGQTICGSAAKTITGAYNSINLYWRSAASGGRNSWDCL